MSEVFPVGISGAETLRLVRHTLEQLELHLGEAELDRLSDRVLLEVTRDRISTLYALMVNLIDAPGDARLSAECPRCAECCEPIVWSEVKQVWTHRDNGTLAVAETRRGAGS